MDSGRDHEFAFNEAISFLVHCESQEEIDRYWDALSPFPRPTSAGG
jgi:predicted 3-demethylubiquinone-9 3-methyltransferase (glyoxalase superfamily)